MASNYWTSVWRALCSLRATDATLAVTENGIGVGTPLYAAPELLLARPFDVRADVYSLGAILFEMLTGRPPFSGATLAELIHAVVHEPPPVLAGSPAVWALDRVVRRALAKAPSDRYLDIASFADALSPTRALLDGGAVTETRAMTRLAVLPFRLLRTDPEIEYLSLSLADVIANALSGLESLVVRSSLSTAKYATGVPDLGAAARELSVDVVLTGTVLRSHNRLRVSAQLMSAPAGDMLWSHTLQVDMDTIFELHDELAQRVIQSLPLTRDDVRRGPRLRPTSAKAFDLYMRGMQLRMEAATWRRARDLFDQCLGIDAGFAPAWAERGRLDRVLAKYQDSTLIAQAESALQRALELDPDSGPAHYYRAQLEIDTGRPDEALMRLVKRAAARHAEPQVYAGLVHACRVPVACCASPCPLISMHGGSIPPSARVCSTRITSSVTTTAHLTKPPRAATRWRHESWVRQGETLKPSRPRVARRPGSRSFRDWRHTAQPYEPPSKVGHPTCWRLPSPMTRRASPTGKICFIGARSVRGPACRAKP